MFHSCAEFLLQESSVFALKAFNCLMRLIHILEANLLYLKPADNVLNVNHLYKYLNSHTQTTVRPNNWVHLFAKLTQKTNDHTFIYIYIYIYNLDLCFHHLIFEIIETHPHPPQTNLPLSSFSIIHFSYAIAMFLKYYCLEVFHCLTQPVKLH